MLRLDPIKFNVKDRGRKHRGLPRAFDTARLAQIINSPAVQERVRNRDLRGYLGHWTRERWGMEPKEAVIDQGKVVPLEPAVVTVRLEASPEGEILHQTEFLDTLTGRTAASMWASKVGGFSSAISLAAGRTDCDYPTNFHGFDYVSEPNFTTNRGYALDSAREGAGVDLSAFDGVVQQHAEELAALDSALAQTRGELERVMAELATMSGEQSYLLGLLARRPDAAALRQALDSAHSFQRPSMTPAGASFADKAADFSGMLLARREEAPSENASVETQSAASLAGAISLVHRRG
ncbi:hypothetical protein [Ideonella livida]|uniref:Uncharacterized protein n=1 Tax=Ideonella livida TaxID=2707176 RepID=A0A7C9PEN1_9BURK|nr:hypothetical protein [Ideonella livida]NDY89728.1 hypothetical protein [Ideonella livida]